ncbi:hypothetical protein COLO4_21952 [Corchorus olitorius]|uniref:Uncharacterized protein n=1 Tax=Corchorus olitorius TaxID=93759 RepID=A0A1R3IPT1_9ROSI|nr:hypothetical protein COLO4_21952 [Corchorus olitorius]
MKNLNPFDHHNVYGFPQKNLDYGLIMGQHSGNFVQSHHVPLKTRNQFDHIQAFPHNKNYGLFMDPQPSKVSTLSQADENLLNLSLNLNANKNRMNPMSMMNDNNLDFNFQSGASSNDHLDIFNVQQSGLASSSRNMPNSVGYSPLGSSFSNDHQGIPAPHHDPMLDNVMFKQPKPYDTWFLPPSMQQDHQPSNFGQLYSESDPRFRSEFLGEFYRNMNHEDHDLANRAFKIQRL